MEKIKQNPDTCKKIAIVSGSVIAGGVAGAVVLPALGFTSSGVAPLSYAAGWQSGIGNVAAGSIFSTCQSLGATGAATYLGAGVGAISGGIAAAAPYGKVIGKHAIDGTKYVINGTGSAASAAAPYGKQAFNFCYQAAKSRL